MNFKRLSIVIAWVLISTLLFEVSAWAAQIKLKDGTLIVGEIQQDKLKLRTSYGEIEIAVRDIASIVGQEIRLRDGSVLKGTLIDPQLTVKTRYGEFKINTKDTASIVFVEEAAEIKKKAPVVTAEKPLTVEELVKISDMEKEEELARGFKLGAWGLLFTGGAYFLVSAIGPFGGEMAKSMLPLLLLCGGGAWWCWDQSKKHQEKANKLRQELKGRALLNFQNSDGKLCLRIQIPSFEVDSEAGQLQWNLINYSF